jgi:chromate transporter
VRGRQFAGQFAATSLISEPLEIITAEYMEYNKKMKAYLELVWAFMKVGVMTFGGGYAMLPILEREIIQKKGWVTIEEVMNYYTIAQVTPGVIAINTATFIGRRVKGNAGGIAATLSFMLPGTILMVVIAFCMRNFSDLPIVRHTFAGIRVAVGALILDTVRKLVKGVFQDAKAVVIMLMVFALMVVFNPSPVLLVIPAGLAGFFVYGARGKRRESGNSGGDGGIGGKGAV